MESARILWVYTENDGPMNGLAEYKGEKLWFSRILTPDTVSSTYVSVPDIVDETTMRKYGLYRLSETSLTTITADHIEYCNTTGSPVNHGDPIKLKGKARASAEVTEINDITVPKNVRAFTNSRKHSRSSNTAGLEGEFMEAISETNFSNYHVPHLVEVA
jgi:hypothetical protein